MNPRGQIFRDGNAETPGKMARRAMREDLISGLAELDTPYGALVALPECPSCGRTGGAPVWLGTGETSSTTGYCDEGDGCTLCDPRRERAQPFEVQEDGDVTF
jgi:hypothetical protein